MKGLSLVVPVLVAVAWPAFAQDRNITLPVPELEQMLHERFHIEHTTLQVDHVRESPLVELRKLSDSGR